MSDALHCCTSFIVVACHGRQAGSVAIIPSSQCTEVHEASRAKVTPKKSEVKEIPTSGVHKNKVGNGRSEREKKKNNTRMVRVTFWQKRGRRPWKRKTNGRGQ